MKLLLLVIPLMFALVETQAAHAVTVTPKMHQCMVNAVNKYGLNAGLLAVTNQSAVFYYLKNNVNMTIANVENCVRIGG